MSDQVETQQKQVVMSGMRPTGKLHLGHYYGVLKNWVKLQDDYHCYYMVADWHALTTKSDESKQLKDHIYDMVLDWLAAGIEPEKVTMYVQSAVPEEAELHLLLSMLTPVKWLETDPTLKDMIAIHEGKKSYDDAMNYGLLGYPVLQTVDILLPLGELVPVGKDQLAHLELSRDIAKRFNHRFETSLFPEPEPLLTEMSALIGLDGRKMSKSYNNTIALSATEKETEKAIKSAITDRNRVKREDAGNPDNCEVVYPYYKFFADETATSLAAEECRLAARGCGDCKSILAEIINEQLRPLRERRETYAKDRAQVERIIAEGNERMRHRASRTITKVRKAMKINYFRK